MLWVFNGEMNPVCEASADDAEHEQSTLHARIKRRGRGRPSSGQRPPRTRRSEEHAPNAPASNPADDAIRDGVVADIHVSTTDAVYGGGYPHASLQNSA